jgi:very-short-patch-repair endonuclease
MADLAARQHGVATRAQLIGVGLTPAQVRQRIRSKRFRLLHRGVYLVTGVRMPRTREMAAVLACGPGSVVSHRSAAALLGLLPHPREPAPVDVTVPGSDRGRRSGVRAHRVTSLGPDQVTEADGIPVTSAPRTILDLASVSSGRELERALARAERRELTNRAELMSLTADQRARRGIRGLRALLLDEGRGALTRSEAEERFLVLVRRAQLPAPEVNVVVSGYEIDFLWRTERLAVEVDGFAHHSSKATFESDRRRDATLLARGFRVVRITWRQITDEPEAVLVRLAQALARGGRR